MGTWNSRGLRGSTLEDMINMTNENYRDKGLALIQKIPTPITPVQIDQTTGFTDIHTVSGSIYVGSISGGAKLETSNAPIFAAFESLNNVLECNTQNGTMELVLPTGTGMKVDGISKRGSITSQIEGLEIKIKPGNVSWISGILGEKPYQNVRLSSINGDILLR